MSLMRCGLIAITKGPECFDTQTTWEEVKETIANLEQNGGKIITDLNMPIEPSNIGFEIHGNTATHKPFYIMYDGYTFNMRFNRGKLRYTRFRKKAMSMIQNFLENDKEPA